MSKKVTTEDFIRRAEEVHGDKYDYSKVNYVNGKTKVTISWSQSWTSKRVSDLIFNLNVMRKWQ